MKKKWNMNNEQSFKHQYQVHQRKLKTIRNDIYKNRRSGQYKKNQRSEVKQLQRIKQLIDRKLQGINQDVLFTRQKSYMTQNSQPIRTKNLTGYLLFTKVQLIQTIFFTFQAYLQQNFVLLSLRNSQKKHLKYQLRLPRAMCNKLVQQRFSGNIQRLGQLIRLQGIKPVLNISTQQINSIMTNNDQSHSKTLLMYKKCSYDKLQSITISKNQSDPRPKTQTFTPIRYEDSYLPDKSMQQLQSFIKKDSNSQFDNRKINLLQPSIKTYKGPSIEQSIQPSIMPSIQPTKLSIEPSIKLSIEPSIKQSIEPFIKSSKEQSVLPSVQFSMQPSVELSIQPSSINFRQMSIKSNRSKRYKTQQDEKKCISESSKKKIKNYLKPLQRIKQVYKDQQQDKYQQQLNFIKKQKIQKNNLMSFNIS